MNADEYLIEINGTKKYVKLLSCYCIGYTGRNKEMTLKHVEELAELGIPEPDEIPSLYPMRKSSITQESSIDVIGSESTGEAEIVLIFGENEKEIYVTVGSDHTDRSLEAVDINKSKQVCDKPFAKKAWNLEEVSEYWDSLELVSFVKTGVEWELYQKQTLRSIIPLEEILNFLEKKKVELKNTIIFSGTVPLIDGFKYGNHYLMELIDPVKQDKISFEYEVKKIAQ